MQTKATEKTILSLANAGELVQNVVRNVVGNEIADTLDGTTLSRGMLYELSQTSFQSHLSKYLGGR